MVSNSNNCAVEDCRNTSKPGEGGTYFILPTDEKRAEKWKNDLRLNKQTSSGEELFICIDHFDGSHFILHTGALLAPNSVPIPQFSEIGANNPIDSDVSSDQEVEIQDEEEVFLPLTSMLDLISPEESPEVLNTPSFINIDPLQSKSESLLKQLESKADGPKQESNMCRVCLQPGSVNTLPTVLRDTYFNLCNADDQSSMPEPTLCLVCRRLLYNAHKFKELCRAAHVFLTQIFDNDQLEKFSKNLHKLFHHPNLTTVHNVVEKCNYEYFIIKDVSDNYDGPEVNEYRSKIIRDGPKVHRGGLKVHRSGPNENEGALILNKIEPKIMKVPNVKKELLIEIQPSQYLINIHDSGSDTNCNDDDDETFGRADLEIKSNNINTLIAIAESRKTIAPQKNTAVKKINKCRRKIPTVQRKTTKPKMIKILEIKKLAFAKKREYHYVPDQKVFDEYIETSPLTLEDQKKKFEEKKMSVAYRHAPYKCDICYNIFNTEDTFKRHMRHMDFH